MSEDRWAAGYQSGRKQGLEEAAGIIRDCPKEVQVIVRPMLAQIEQAARIIRLESELEAYKRANVEIKQNWQKERDEWEAKKKKP